MQTAAAPALRAGDVVVCGRKFMVVIPDGTNPLQLGAILVRRGPLERLRSHILPDSEELRGAGLPLSNMILCCDRIRPMPTAAIRVGTASPALLRQIQCTVRRVAEAVAAENAAPIRATIWRCPGGDRGRQVGAKSVS